MKSASRAQARNATIAEPLVWTFDGPFARCLTDMEDALRRAIVQLGDIGAVAVLIELSLPALKARVDAGDTLQPAWGDGHNTGLYTYQYLRRIDPARAA